VNLLLDTNVLVAALMARGSCSEVLEHCVRHYAIVSSQSLLDELRDVLTRKFRQRVVDVRTVVRLFEDTFTLVAPEPFKSPVCRYPDDDVVLATAIAARCTAVISGDQDLLVLGPFHDIRVIAPAAFWQWESESTFRRHG